MDGWMENANGILRVGYRHAGNETTVNNTPRLFRVEALSTSVYGN